MKIMSPSELVQSETRFSDCHLVLMANAGDHAGIFIDQDVVTIVTTHPMRSLRGLIQMLVLPMLNDIGISTIFGGDNATFFVPSFMMATEMLSGRCCLDGLCGALALIIGLCCHCCAGRQQCCTHSQDEFRFHDVSLVDAKLVAEPQVKDSGKCQRTHLPGGKTVPKAWLLRIQHRKAHALCM
jgi:hypothetical protein